MVEVLEVEENVKPIFRKNHDMVYVNLLNLDKESVEIKVYDSNNRVIFYGINFLNLSLLYAGNAMFSIANFTMFKSFCLVNNNS